MLEPTKQELKNKIKGLTSSLQVEIQMSGRETKVINALQHEVTVLNENLEAAMRENKVLHYAIKYLEAK